MDWLYNIVEPKEKFNNFFKNHKGTFIGNEFNNRFQFEKNFDYYFNYEKKLNIEGKFYIYDKEDFCRSALAKQIKNFSLNKGSVTYYGISGKGKSVTFIGALKYRKNYQNLSTLDINCKTLKNLIKKKLIN